MILMKNCDCMDYMATLPDEHAAQATLFAPQELRAGNDAQLGLGGL